MEDCNISYLSKRKFHGGFFCEGWTLSLLGAPFFR
ncbi:hypothetical protein LINGRAHAP2_LOCUS10270 [Linum grandiflorum]